MPRPRKPQWNTWGAGRKGYWRTKINGKYETNDEIPQHEKPQIAGIPVRAWDWLRNLEAAVKATQKADTETGTVTVGSLLARYLKWIDAACEAGDLSKGQAKGIRSRIRLFLSMSQSGEITADALTVDTLARSFATIRDNGYSDHYVAGVGRTVRAAFRWGAEPIAGRIPARLIDTNPITGYAFPRAPKAVKQYLDGKIVRRFLRWAWAQARAETGLKRRFDRLFVLMLRFQRITGCRPGEACDLRWADITWEGKSPRAILPPSRQKTGKKTGKDRVIYLTHDAIRLLRRLQRLPDRHEVFVFTHMRGRNAEVRGHTSPLAGEPWPSGSAASAKVAELRSAAIAAKVKGIKKVGPTRFVAYVNRHGYASEAIARGSSDEQVASMLGNTPEVVRQTYAHSITDDEANLAREIAANRRKRPTES